MQKKKFEHTKKLIRSRKAKKNRQSNGLKKNDIRQIMVDKRLHGKLKIEQHELNTKPEVNRSLYYNGIH